MLQDGRLQRGQRQALELARSTGRRASKDTPCDNFVDSREARHTTRDQGREAVLAQACAAVFTGQVTRRGPHAGGRPLRAVSEETELSVGPGRGGSEQTPDGVCHTAKRVLHLGFSVSG